VPGSSFATYTWGDPNDFPLQVVSDTSLEWRNVIPVASNGYIQTLDVVEQALDSGTSPPGLAQFLSREGINYVVEQNDLDVAATGAPPPVQVHQVLSETPGLTEVASFGPILPLKQVEFGSLPVYDSPQDLRLRPVEIFRVDSSTSIVQTYPATDPVVVSGDAGSLLPLAGANVVKSRAAVLAGDTKAQGVATAKDATWAITDGNQRRYLSFGGIRNNQSYLLNADQNLPGAQAGVPASFAVVKGVTHQTVESPIGASLVSASSYGSSSLFDDPQEGPAAAFDGNPGTAWVASSTDHSIGQWVEITFKHPRKLSTISVSPLVGSTQQPTVSRITITTDSGSVSRSLPATYRQVRLSVPKGKSRHLKITITATRAVPPAPNGGIVLGAGITDIAIPGVSFHQQMKVPDDETQYFAGPGRNSPQIVFDRPISNSNLSIGFSETDDPAMARLFSVPKAMAGEITGYAVPRPGVGLEDLLEYLTVGTSSELKVTASSWLGDLPRFRPENLAGNSGSPWIANFGDKTPSLNLSWGQTRTISSISLSLSTQASRPTEIAITSSTGTRLFLPVPAKGGLIRFSSLPLTTDSLQIQFVKVARKSELSPISDVQTPLPVGLSNVTLPDLNIPVVGPLDLQTPVNLVCGQGPALTIDGKSIPTSVSGTLGDLVDLKPMRIAACPPGGGGVQLATGAHSFEADDSTNPFEVTSVAIKAVGASGTPSVAAPRTAKVERWTAENRTIKVGAGPATYLAVAQNYNSGWTAKLGNQTLEPVRLDGWQQGYLVPAGKSGVLTMTMGPDKLFRLLLAFGAALLVALLALSLVPSHKKTQDASGPRSTPARWVLFVGAIVVLAVISGPLALIAIPLVFAAQRYGDGFMAITASGAFVVAGAVAAWDPAVFGSQGAGAFSSAAQIASVVALAAVLCTLTREGRRRERRGESVDR
jgi:arabinofuranan 3-O-arabinosyltransferase